MKKPQVMSFGPADEPPGSQLTTYGAQSATHYSLFTTHSLQRRCRAVLVYYRPHTGRRHAYTFGGTPYLIVGTEIIQRPSLERELHFSKYMDGVKQRAVNAGRYTLRAYLVDGPGGIVAEVGFCIVVLSGLVG